MAQELYTRTNQKLYFAGLALEAWKRADAERAMNAQAIIQGERESALFHLYGAVLGVCHEIAGYYRLPQAAAPRVDALLNAEVLAAAPSPELLNWWSWRRSRKPGWASCWAPTPSCSCRRDRPRQRRSTPAHR